MRFIYLIVFLFLTACSPTEEGDQIMKAHDIVEEKVEQQVILTNIPSELNFTIGEGCKFRSQAFSVFGQKTQKFSFKYQECSKAALRQFTLIGSNEIIDKATGKSLLVVGKQGADTQKGYMEKMAHKADPEKCTVMQTDEGFWVLIGESYDNPYTISGTIAGHPRQAGLYETKCDHYEGFWGPKGWAFKFQDGIVFGIRLENVKNTIDLSSVTYTNYG